MLDVFELVSGPPVHEEVEHHEVRPGVNRVVEDIDPLVRPCAGRAEVGLSFDPVREVELLDIVVHRDADILQKAVHGAAVPYLVPHDLRDDELLLRGRCFHDPRDVAEPPCEFRVGLLGHEVRQQIEVLVAHLIDILDRFLP